jgi:hypothetical protein
MRTKSRTVTAVAPSPHAAAVPIFILRRGRLDEDQDSLVARHCEVEVWDNGPPRCDNRPVRLCGNGKRHVNGAREIGGHCATAAYWDDVTNSDSWLLPILIR